MFPEQAALDREGSAAAPQRDTAVRSVGSGSGRMLERELLFGAGTGTSDRNGTCWIRALNVDIRVFVFRRGTARNGTKLLWYGTQIVGTL